MRLRISSIVLAFLFSLTGYIANAVPVPTLNVPALAAASNLIVVANVISIRDEGPTSIDVSGVSISARNSLCEAEVVSVLKGTTNSRSILVEYVTPSEPIGYAGVVVGYQILFLKSENSTYSFTSPYHTSLPAASLPVSEDGDELAKIAVTLGAALKSPKLSLSKKEVALYGISTIQNSESTNALHRQLEQSDEDLRLNAVGFLLLRDDLSALHLAEIALVDENSVSSHTLHNLKYAIRVGVKNEKAIPTLSRLTTSVDIETRRAVASALRHTQSRKALAPLARLLDDSDVQVRHEAVVALAEISGDLNWGPNLDSFQSDEEMYQAHWRHWAKENGVYK